MIHIALFLSLLVATDDVRWPAPPADPLATLVDVIDLREAEPETGFWKRVGRIIGGAAEGEQLSAPFDLEVHGDTIWLTSQEALGLIRLNRSSSKFRVYSCEELPVDQPVAVTRFGDAVLMTDSGRGVVYRLDGDELRVWLDAGLERPTGIAARIELDRVWVADTATHQVVVYDGAGTEVGRIGSRDVVDAGLNYPTFMAATADGLVVNDTLNYRIKTYSASGELVSAFGEEGSGPGQFVRAKGVAVTTDGRILVVDGMQDRVHVLAADGSSIVQIGTQGEEAGMFWSPAGVDVSGDLAFVADTYNHRIQVLRLEGQGEAP